MTTWQVIRSYVFLAVAITVVVLGPVLLGTDHITRTSAVLVAVSWAFPFIALSNYHREKH